MMRLRVMPVIMTAMTVINKQRVGKCTVLLVLLVLSTKYITNYISFEKLFQ